MSLSTFKVSVTDTNEPGVFEATAREFKINFSSQTQDDSITPQEGIVTALGTCENIVSASVYDKHKLDYDSYLLLSRFTSPKKIEVKFDLKKHQNLLPEIKQAIKDTSPVYHNITNAIPITTRVTKETNK